MLPPSGKGSRGPRVARYASGALNPCERLLQAIDHRVDVLALRDQRRGADHAVAGCLDLQAVVEELVLQGAIALARPASSEGVARRPQDEGPNNGDDRNTPVR